MHVFSSPSGALVLGSCHLAGVLAGPRPALPVCAAAAPGPRGPLGLRAGCRGADQLLLSPCSMNVQGDYEPIDATGFININALR